MYGVIYMRGHTVCLLSTKQNKNEKAESLMGENSPVDDSAFSLYAFCDYELFMVTFSIAPVMARKF